MLSALLDISMNISSTGVSETNMIDQDITCRDCGKQFTFTESEQEFFKTKGFTHPRSLPRLPRRPQGRAQRWQQLRQCIQRWQQLRR